MAFRFGGVRAALPARGVRALAEARCVRAVWDEAKRRPRDAASEMERRGSTVLLNLVAVALGGAIGASFRYLVGLLASAAIPAGTVFASVPVGTLCANVVGCFVIGLLSCFFSSADFAGRDTWRLFAITGVLGGFTTFSTFSLESITLFGENPAAGGAYAVGTLAVCLVAAFLGRALGRIAW